MEVYGALYIHWEDGSGEIIVNKAYINDVELIDTIDAGSTYVVYRIPSTLFGIAPLKINISQNSSNNVGAVDSTGTPLGFQGMGAGPYDYVWEGGTYSAYNPNTSTGYAEATIFA